MNTEASGIPSVEQPNVDLEVNGGGTRPPVARTAEPTGDAVALLDPNDRRRLLDAWMLVALPAILTLLVVFVLPVLYLAANSRRRRYGAVQEMRVMGGLHHQYVLT